MSYQIEYRHLRYFLAVAKELHFRKAAEQLYISQPGLSRQIRELEKALGFQLFERTKRKVALTESGRYLQTELENHFKGLGKIFQQAKMIDEGLLGEITLAYVGSAMQEIIPTLLIAFRKKHPNILFSLTEMDNQKQMDGLLSGDIDIGFVRLVRIPKGIESYAVLEEPFSLVMPSNHAISRKNFKDLSQLKEESFILFDPKYSPSYYEKVLQIFEESGYVPNVSHKTIHSSSIYKLVENNFGISIIPKSLQLKNNKGVKFIELDKIPHRTTLFVVWKKENKNPLIEMILQEIKNHDN